MEVLRSSTYARYIFGGPRVVAFAGPRIALIVDVDSAGDELDVERMAAEWAPATARVLGLLESLLQLYESVTGYSPPLSDPWHGRMRVEVGDIGAAGLAHHGRLGFAVGPAFVKSMLDAQLEGRPCIHHVFGYEMLRNFIDPDRFTRAFDYRCCAGACAAAGPAAASGGLAAARAAHLATCRTDADSWGWVNQGFVNVVGCLLSEQLRCSDRPVAFDYFGHTRSGFKRMMEENVERYLGGGAQPPPAAGGSAGSGPGYAYAWETVFLHDRLPWNDRSSLDNAYSGVLTQLYDECGGPALLAGMWRAIPVLLENRAPSSKDDWRTAAENFALAACVGAGADLSGKFAALRWPLRPGVLGPGSLAEALIAADGGGGSAERR